MIEQNNYMDSASAEEEIDLMELVMKAWDARVAIIKWAIAGAIVGLMVGFSIPKTYTASAVLAPETEQAAGSSVSSIASMMGISLDNSVDAINIQVFPDVVHSTPFIFDLFDLEVRTIDGKLETTLLDYMLEHQKRAWWSYVTGAPFKFIGWALSLGKEEDEADMVLDPMNLPEKERGVIKYFAENISVNTDKKTGKTSISVVMQDPLVAATVTSAVLENLKEYMADYRTSKARQDVENLTKICDERKEDYRKAQSAYAEYVDANRNLVLQTAQVERERLQQEMNLAYQVYSQVATQLEGARVKEQQAKPVFAVIEPVTVPIKKTAPKKATILVAFAFLAALIQVAWVCACRGLWESFRERGRKEE